MKARSYNFFAISVLLGSILFSGAALCNDIEGREKQLSLREQALQEQLQRHKTFVDDLMKKNAVEKAQRSRELADLKKKWEEALAKKDLEIKSLKQANESQNIEKKNQFLSIYEKMEPKKAAKIIETLDRKLASEVVSEMKAPRAAEILGKVSAEVAKEITELSLKERHSRQVNKIKENSPNSPIGLGN